jgi:membrane-bound serine protease (ClpP class)
VVEVSGFIDPVAIDFVDHALADAERTHAEALVLQLNSRGTLVSQSRFDAFVDRLFHQTAVPVAVWVGPSGSRALGAAARLVTESPLSGLAPNSKVQLPGGTVGPVEATKRGVTKLNREESAVLGSFLAALDGRKVEGRVLETANFDPRAGRPPEASLTVEARLAKLPFGARLMHTFASPPVAYLLLLAGLVLLVFEFFTAGVGIAGVVGAVALVLSAYGLTVLPTNLLGIGLIVVGIFGFSVDVQTAAPRVWTGIGVVALAVGSLVLFDDPAHLGWLPLVAGVVGVVLMMLAGLPATVRSRFSTPTIGRSSMIGELGEAAGDVRPEGVVRVREALWPARTNRATPIAAGERVRVVAIEGVRLEVEPEAGGAVDYRERRSRH